MILKSLYINHYDTKIIIK